MQNQNLKTDEARSQKPFFKMTAWLAETMEILKENATMA